jgi:hypothetical protein
MGLKSTSNDWAKLEYVIPGAKNFLYEVIQTIKDRTKASHCIKRPEKTLYSISFNNKCIFQIRIVHKDGERFVKLKFFSGVELDNQPIRNRDLKSTN